MRQLPSVGHAFDAGAGALVPSAIIIVSDDDVFGDDAAAADIAMADGELQTTPVVT